MLSRFYFLPGAARPFFTIDETRFSLDKVKFKTSIFVTIESVLTSVSTSKNISDQHSSKF